MKPRQIACDTFRAVFETGISDQGQLNTFYHEEQCGVCHDWAEDQRVQTISCERFQELVAIPFAGGHLKMLRKHLKHCVSEQCYRDKRYEKQIFKLLVTGAFGWMPKKGRQVRITDGPFENFTGSIVEMCTEECLIVVHTNVFGHDSDVKVQPSYIESYAEGE